MPRVQILHGAWVNIPSPDEIVDLLPKPMRHTRIRAAETVELDANGNTPSGGFVVYKVPIGAEFAIRRVTFDLGNVNGPNLATASVSLLAPGMWVEYLRSGLHLGWAMPANPTGNNKVPGTETWGDQQGSYLRNGEQFGIVAGLGAASAGVSLTATVEGILTENRPDA